MSEEVKTYLSHTNSNSFRLSKDEVEYIQENWEDITETSEKIAINKFVMMAVTKAVSNVKPKVIYQSKPEDLATIQQLNEDLEKTKAESNENARIAQKLQMDLDDRPPIDDADFKLFYPEATKAEIRQIIDIAVKLNQWAKTDSEFFYLLLKNFQKQFGAFVPTAEDIAELAKITE